MLATRPKARPAATNAGDSRGRPRGVHADAVDGSSGVAGPAHPWYSRSRAGLNDAAREGESIRSRQNAVTGLPARQSGHSAAGTLSGARYSASAMLGTEVHDGLHAVVDLDGRDHGAAASRTRSAQRSNVCPCCARRRQEHALAGDQRPVEGLQRQAAPAIGANGAKSRAAASAHAAVEEPGDRVRQQRAARHRPGDHVGVLGDRAGISSMRSWANRQIVEG